MYDYQIFNDVQEEFHRLSILLVKISTRQYSPLLKQVKSKEIPEGASFSIISKGKEDVLDFKKIESKIVITKENYLNLDFPFIIVSLIRLGYEMAKQIDKKSFQKINSVLEAAGQTVNANNQPFTHDLLLKLFDKIEIEFDNEGKMMPGYTFFLHPDLLEKIAPQVKEWESDPAKKEAFNKLMEKKYNEYLTKESNRKLLD